MLIPISKIYEDFLESIESETIALKTAFLARKSLYKYLKNSITRFSTCKKTITIVGNIIGDGEIDVGSNTFIINDCPKKPNIEVYYELEDKGIIELCKLKDYKVEEIEENKFSVTLTEVAKNQIYVDYFLDGNLEIDSEDGLTLLEQRIIVEGN